MFKFFRQRKIAQNADRRSNVQLVQPQPRTTTMITANNRPSPIYRLYQEVIDRIIDALILPGRKLGLLELRSLSNCSLVCRSFQPRSQMHLFSYIELLDNTEEVFERSYEGRNKSFLQIINARPLIASHVQDLRLVIQKGKLSWLVDQPDVTQILDLISTTGPIIRKLTLAGKEDSGFYELQDPSVILHCPALRRNIFPYITSLCFDTLQGIPPQLVAMCPNLEELKILWAQFLDVEFAPSTWTNPPAIKTLECVTIGPRSDLDRVLQEQYVNLHSLRRLTAYLDDVYRRIDSLDFEQKLIDGCPNSLEILTVDIYDYYRSYNLRLTSTVLNLERLRSLHTLSLIALINDGMPEGFSDICSTLKTLSRSSSRLSNLQLVLRVQGDLQKLHEADWKGLYDVIKAVSVSSGRQCIMLSLYMRYFPLLKTRPGRPTFEEECRVEPHAQRSLEGISKKWFGLRNDQSCRVVRCHVDVEPQTMVY